MAPATAMAPLDLLSPRALALAAVSLPSLLYLLHWLCILDEADAAALARSLPAAGEGNADASPSSSSRPPAHHRRHKSEGYSAAASPSPSSSSPTPRRRRASTRTRKRSLASSSSPPLPPTPLLPDSITTQDPTNDDDGNGYGDVDVGDNVAFAPRAPPPALVARVDSVHGTADLP